MNLNKGQEEAMKKFEDFIVSEDRIMLISGSAGTGKSALTKYMLKDFMQTIQISTKLGAKPTINKLELSGTTHASATVLNNVIEAHKANTIHSLLKLTVVNNYKTGKTELKRKQHIVFNNTLLVIDEVSMLNEELLDIILESLTHTSKLLLIGDLYQLPPVDGSNTSITDIVEVNVELTEIMRQKNSIRNYTEFFRNAVRDRTKPNLNIQDSNILFLDAKKYKDKIIEVYTSDEANTEYDYVKSLSWTNESVNSTNTFIKKNAYGHSDNIVPNTFMVNNNMILLNSTMLANNQTVFVVDVEEDEMFIHHGYDNLKVYYINLRTQYDKLHRVPAVRDHNQYNNYLKSLSKEKNWPLYFNLKEAIADLRPSYACTVNKAQGKTYNTVFLNLENISKCFDRDTLNRLLYVAFTRATDKIYIYSGE